MKTWQTKIIQLLSSPKFFAAILVLFLLQASYIALSANYPMVFDENTHFGIIQLHATQLSPIFTQQPPDSGFAGALTRDPSYLFRYALSFPYRFIVHVTENQPAHIIFLRFFNIAFFAAGLILFRKLFLKVNISPAIIHAVLLLFILIPVVPLLAGQINYDNLLMPLAALLMLLAVSINQSLENKKVPVSTALLFMTTGLLGCLVQFAFLPIFAGTFLWVGWRWWQAVRKNSLRFKHDLAAFWQHSSWLKRAGYVAPLVISLGLFMQMYAVNLVEYHNLIPQCHQVLDKEQCALNGAWQRNYEARLNNDGSANTSPVLYAASWSYRMAVSLFYTSSGGANPATAWYLSINPLPIPFIAALALFVVGVALVMYYNKSLLRGHTYLGGLLFVSLFYCLALWLRNYQDFVHLGEKVAINGRYLLPVLLPILVTMALAYYKLFSGRRGVMVGALACMLMVFTQGGGVTTYIVRSNPAWYWPNQTVIQVNDVLQQVAKPIVVVEDSLPSISN